MIDLDFYRDKRVFITGHTGFVGSWMCHVLLEAGAHVNGYALAPGTTPNLFDLCGFSENMNSTIGDVRDFKKLDWTLEAFDPDIVIHLAAQPLVRESYQSPAMTYETNVMGTVNLLESIRNMKHPARSVLNVTTDKVYQNNETANGFREEDPLDGFDPYSNSKSCSELITHCYNNSFYKNQGIALSTARAGNIIGGGDFGKDRILPDCIRATQQRIPIMVRNSKSIRPYQHVLESVFAYLLIAQKQFEDIEFAGYYNIGPDESGCLSTGRLVDYFCKSWGDEQTWTNGSDPTDPHEATYLKLNCEKIKKTMGWEPKWDGEKAVEKTVEWYKGFFADLSVSSIMDRQVQEYLKGEGKIFMFKNMSEAQARDKILEMVKEYYEAFPQKAPPFAAGQRISYAGRVYDEDELTCLVDSSLDFWLTAGRYTDEFEKSFSDYLGINHCTLVNSGSSANLLAFMALTSPLLEERSVRPGDEVITVSAGFPTTIAPIVQYGGIPVFVDVTIPQYNIDINLLEDAYSEKTRAVMIAHTLGNPFDIQSVKRFCDSHGLWLIEDNCDSLGSKVKVNGKMQMTGTFGDIGTSSFYPPHHMTMGEGGAVYTNNPLLHKIVRSLRDWGRDCVCPPGKDNLCGHRYDGDFGLLPKGYDHKYVYSHFGYNLKATDMQAAVGCAQLRKLPGFTLKRIDNFKRLKNRLLCISDKVILPEALPGSEPSWFGFLVTCRDCVDRNAVVEHLEAQNVQTRMLFAGNMICHPCFDQMRQRNDGYRVVGELINTNIIMNQSFWVGVYPGMTDEMIDFMADTIIEGVSR